MQGVVTVTRVSDNAEGALSDPGNANPDFNFRFNGGEYHFNLQTSSYAPGTHLLSFKAANSPATYTVEVKVR